MILMVHIILSIVVARIQPQEDRRKQEKVIVNYPQSQIRTAAIYRLLKTKALLVSIFSCSQIIWTNLGMKIGHERLKNIESEQK